jgi:microcystin-dependent protein
MNDIDILGLVKIFCGSYAPVNWMFCEGQLLSVTQYSQLFTVIGATYGGDGHTTFALPDLRGAVAIHTNSNPGAGQSAYTLGQSGGSPEVTILTSQMPAHNHAPTVNNTNATEHVPGANGANAMAAPMDASINDTLGFNNTNNADLVPMPGTTTTTVGGSEAHSNLQPYLALSYVICVQGIMPLQS